ncbi:MAG: ribosomal L7Ae/L30e/S12e/Gadd45 family protein [Lachnospiraceae bacterium]|nr:ribosomal L7Ae/L30e/S12e/Gadd45 family protein [Lachnospiraceae bacterium]
MLQKDKILGYLGLATRAGRAVSGEFSVEKSVRQNRAKLVIVSEEASENSRKNFHNLCTYYKIPLYFFGSKEELGAACGKELRVSVAVEDEGLARAAIRQLEQN